MSEKKNEIKVRLTPEELESLDQKVAKTVMSREKFCRTLINGSSVYEAPTPGAIAFIQEVRQVGMLLVEIRNQAKHQGLDTLAQELAEAFDSNRKTERAIVSAYCDLSDIPR